MTNEEENKQVKKILNMIDEYLSGISDIKDRKNIKHKIQCHFTNERSTIQCFDRCNYHISDAQVEMLYIQRFNIKTLESTSEKKKIYEYTEKVCKELDDIRERNKEICKKLSI